MNVNLVGCNNDIAVILTKSVSGTVEDEMKVPQRYPHLNPCNL